MRHPIAILAILCFVVALGCEKKEVPTTVEPAPPMRAMPALKPSKPAKPSAAVATRPTPPTPRITKPTLLVPRPETETKPIHPAMKTYTIRKDDTLWSIARKELGDGRRWREIVVVNPGLDPRKLKPHQIIKLPPK